ncbi:MAG: two-component regulator propeller domain-containing protein [Bryobacteraceae bacterium]
MKNTFAVLAAAAFALAAGTKTWEHSSQADFEKGKLEKLSLRSDGRLSLAPVLEEMHDPSTNYLWAVAEDSKGNVWFGGSGLDGKTKLYRTAPGGATRTVTELTAIEIHAIAIDSRDRVYVATAPDGKIYRVNGNNADVFYDPKAKYIWALTFSPQGDLYAATGDKGEIHKIAPDGKGSVFFRTEEAHARSLAVDAQGNVYAGTEPSGLVVKISPAGQGFVVYQSSKREITALGVDAKNNVYAAAVGAKPSGGSAAPPPPPPAPAPPPAAGRGAPQPVASPPPTFGGSSVSGGSEVVRIEADGYPRKLWTNANDVVYALAFDGAGRLLLGTGNKGAIYRLDSDLLYTLLVSLSPTQVTSLSTGRGGKVFAVTGNIGKLFRLGPGVEKQGSYESEVLDANFFTYWGRANFNADLHGGTVGVETRTGNLDAPQRNWSPWAAVPLNSTYGRVASPAARFLQYKIALSASQAGDSPELVSVDLAYLPKNVAPVIEMIDLTPANYRFPATSTVTLSSSSPQSLTLPALARNARPSVALGSSDSAPASMTYAKGWVGARWLARDENGDSLTSRIEIRGVKESGWKLLKADIRERGYTFDSTAFADGEYVVRVTVSDAPGNPPGQALTAQLVSDPFVIDNTPPKITGLAATRNGNTAEVRWKVSDALNVIDRAEYSVDGGEWKVAPPTTRLSDSREHDYVLTLDLSSGEHTVAIRVTDDFDNQAVEQTTVQ